MTQHLIATHTEAGAFDTIEQADRAIRRLLAAGYSKDQVAVICPAKFKDHFHSEVSQTESPPNYPVDSMALGGVVGAALGGVALTATVMTGGAASVPGALLLLGGGAILGGFSNLIISNGYVVEEDDLSRRAIQRGKIVVGVEVQGEEGASKLAEARRILDESGAEPLMSA